MINDFISLCNRTSIKALMKGLGNFWAGEHVRCCGVAFLEGTEAPHPARCIHCLLFPSCSLYNKSVNVSKTFP